MSLQLDEVVGAAANDEEDEEGRHDDDDDDESKWYESYSFDWERVGDWLQQWGHRIVAEHKEEKKDETAVEVRWKEFAHRRKMEGIAQLTRF